MPDSNRNDSTSLRGLLAILRRRAWILLPCVLVATGVAFLVSHGQEKRYSATASLLFIQNGLSQQLFGYATSSPVDPTTAAATNITLVSQPTVAIATARALHIQASRVAAEMSVAAAGASDIVKVTATDPSPKFAAAIANTYAQQFIAYRMQADRAQVVQAAAELQGQINRLRNANPAASQLRNLETRLSQLDVLASIQTGDVQLSQMALVPLSPSSPNTKRTTIVGFAAGLLLGILAVFLAERIDQTLRDPEEVRQLVRLPVLGVIPTSRALARNSTVRSTTTPLEDETFRLLRAQLRYFNVDREVKSVLISSAAPGDGKSTVAWNLARTAAALASDSSVLLIDADLRRPTIAQLAGIPSVPGLAELLTRDLAIDDVVRTAPLEDADGATWSAGLHVVTAGAAAPNPFELLESNKLRDVLAELQTRYDFIVIDAPPTSIVSDAIPLMSQVSGLIIVVRLRHTRREALRRLSEQLTGLGAHALGLVVNDVPATAKGYRTYYAGYAPQAGADTEPREVKAAVRD